MIMRKRGKIDHSQKELDQSVEVFLNELIQLRQKENILIYSDQASDHSLSSAIQAHAEIRGGRAEILRLNSELSLHDQARQLSKRIKKGTFDAICELSEQYFYHTFSWKVARKMGARIFSIAGLDVGSFIRCVGKVNHEAMFQFGMTLKRVLHDSRSLHVFTKNGTDIRMQLGLNPLHRLVARLQRQPRSFILPPCGLLDDRTRATFLGGQLAFLGIPKTLEGTAVIDGYLWPPPQIGLLGAPLIVRIEKGKVVEIVGCPTKSKILKRWFEGQTMSIQHFCIGFNPGARLSGKILEVERTFGSISIGIGKGGFHTDGVIKSPSMIANQSIIEENGSFVLKQLLSLEKELLPNE